MLYELKGGGKRAFYRCNVLVQWHGFFELSIAEFSL